MNLSDYDYQLIIGNILPIDPSKKLTDRISRSKRKIRIDITPEVITTYNFMDKVTDDMWSKLVIAFERHLSSTNNYIEINGDLYDRRKIECLFSDRI